MISRMVKTQFQQGTHEKNGILDPLSMDIIF